MRVLNFLYWKDFLSSNLQQVLSIGKMYTKVKYRLSKKGRPQWTDPKKDVPSFIYKNPDTLDSGEATPNRPKCELPWASKWIER